MDHNLSIIPFCHWFNLLRELQDCDLSHVGATDTQLVFLRKSFLPSKKFSVSTKEHKSLDLPHYHAVFYSGFPCSESKAKLITFSFLYFLYLQKPKAHWKACVFWISSQQKFLKMSFFPPHKIFVFLHGVDLFSLTSVRIVSKLCIGGCQWNSSYRIFSVCYYFTRVLTKVLQDILGYSYDVVVLFNVKWLNWAVFSLTIDFFLRITSSTRYDII